MRVVVGSFEIPACDLERAAAFYRRAFGWEVRPVSWPGAAYLAVGPSRLEAGEAELVRGGMGAPETVGAEVPLLVLHVGGGSLEDCIAGVLAAGGTVAEPPHAVAGFGHFARVRDSEGNLLGLWRPGL